MRANLTRDADASYTALSFRPTYVHRTVPQMVWFFPVYRPRDNGIRGQGLIGTETADNAFGQDGERASLSSLPPDLWSQQLSNFYGLLPFLQK